MRKNFCARCSKKVDPSRGQIVGDRIWHEACFSCVVCKKPLNSSTFTAHKGELFCPSCYKKTNFFILNSKFNVDESTNSKESFNSRTSDQISTSIENDSNLQQQIKKQGPKNNAICLDECVERAKQKNVNKQKQSKSTGNKEQVVFDFVADSPDKKTPNKQIVFDLVENSQDHNKKRAVSKKPEFEKKTVVPKTKQENKRLKPKPKENKSDSQLFDAIKTKKKEIKQADNPDTNNNENKRSPLMFWKKSPKEEKLKTVETAKTSDNDLFEEEPLPEVPKKTKNGFNCTIPNKKTAKKVKLKKEETFEVCNVSVSDLCEEKEKKKDKKKKQLKKNIKNDNKKDEAQKNQVKLMDEESLEDSNIEKENEKGDFTSNSSDSISSVKEVVKKPKIKVKSEDKPKQKKAVSKKDESKGLGNFFNFCKTNKKEQKSPEKEGKIPDISFNPAITSTPKKQTETRKDPKKIKKKKREDFASVDDFFKPIEYRTPKVRKNKTIEQQKELQPKPNQENEAVTAKKQKNRTSITAPVVSPDNLDETKFFTPKKQRRSLRKSESFEKFFTPPETMTKQKINHENVELTRKKLNFDDTDDDDSAEGKFIVTAEISPNKKKPSIKEDTITNKQKKGNKDSEKIKRKSLTPQKKDEKVELKWRNSKFGTNKKELEPKRDSRTAEDLEKSKRNSFSRRKSDENYVNPRKKDENNKVESKWRNSKLTPNKREFEQKKLANLRRKPEECIRLPNVEEEEYNSNLTEETEEPFQISATVTPRKQKRPSKKNKKTSLTSLQEQKTDNKKTPQQTEKNPDKIKRNKRPTKEINGEDEEEDELKKSPSQRPKKKYEDHSKKIFNDPKAKKILEIYTPDKNEKKQSIAGKQQRKDSGDEGRKQRKEKEMFVIHKLNNETDENESLEQCERCKKKVFIVERVIAAGGVYHTRCFTCFSCQRHLDSLNITPRRGEVFCKQCYMKYFGPHLYGFGLTSNLNSD